MNTSEIRKENLINLYNEQGERHGYWEFYNSNGQLLYKGNYVNGKEHGYWESYFGDVHVVKQRNGRTGAIVIGYHMETTKFFDIDSINKESNINEIKKFVPSDMYVELLGNDETLPF